MPLREPSFGLWYDFRFPSSAGRSPEDGYREIFDQIVQAEQLGYGSVWLSEHHFAEDGYSPSPLALAAAVAVRTKRIAIGTSLVVLPLHDPVRVAEDAATVSILSDGRFDLGVAQGYRREEFAAFGRRLSHRPSLLEEGVEVIRQSWSGEPLRFQGRHFSYPGVRVTPVPAARPKVLIGAASDVAIARVARIGDGFLASRREHIPVYLTALEREGRSPAEARVYHGDWLIVSDDPERTWSEIGEHAAYQMRKYAEWGVFGPPADAPSFADRDAVLSDPRGYRVLHTEAAVEELVALLRTWPQIRDFHFWARLPGETHESSSARIEHFARRVIPRVRARIGAQATVRVGSS